MLNYCLSLFIYDIGNVDECLNTIKPMLSVYDNEILLAPFTEEEIKITVFFKVGQRVNHHKSSTSFNNNVDQIERAMICSVLEVRRTTYHGKYLGIPSFIGRIKKRAFDFLKYGMWARINNWNNKKMSRAGKEVLLKSVAQALSNYVMFVILLPMGVCHDIERMFNTFWRGNKMNGGNGIPWMHWDRFKCAIGFQWDWF